MKKIISALVALAAALTYSYAYANFISSGGVNGVTYFSSNSGCAPYSCYNGIARTYGYSTLDYAYVRAIGTNNCDYEHQLFDVTTSGYNTDGVQTGGITGTAECNGRQTFMKVEGKPHNGRTTPNGTIAAFNTSEIKIAPF